MNEFTEYNQFDINDTYYLIANTENIWSTKRAIYVTDADTKYIDWLNDGGIAIHLDTEELLIESLEIYGLDKSKFATLEEKKQIKIKEITSERDRREQAGFDYMGKIFDADATSIQRLTLAAQSASIALAANEPFEINWTVQDDSSITLNANEMIGIIPAIAMHADALHQIGRELKNAVNNATTLDEIETIVWE